LLFCVPALAGHSVAGGWCSPCDTPGCFCDPGENGNGNVSAPKESGQETPSDLGSEALFVLAALILALRYKA